MEMDDSHSNSRIKRQIFHTTSVDAARQTVATRNAQNIANQQHSLVLPAIGSKRSLTDAFEPGFNGNHLDKENFKKPHIFRSRSLPFQNSKKQPQLFPSEIATLYADDDEVDNAEPSEYSQRKLLAATPTDEIDSTLSLAYGVFGLPPTIVTRFRELGVKSIYPWQRNCLLAPDVLSGEKNLIYSAPTGGGKSLVAEVLMLRRIMQEPRAKAILVLPYVALVLEKTRWLRNLVEGTKRPGADILKQDLARNPWQQRADADAVRVVGFHGGSKLKATWNDFEIAVCTIEKANSMINTAIQEGHVSNLKAVVLDEIHMIDDGHRGYLMELLTSKLLSIAQPIQIIGMSATISNIELLGRWVEGHAYVTKYRPVPIDEHLVYDSKIYPAANTLSLIKTAKELEAGTQDSSEQAPCAIRAIRPSIHTEFQDPVLNAVVALACETANSGYGVLVFSSSRTGCETVAKWISRALPNPQKIPLKVLEPRLSLIEELGGLSTGLDHVLAETIPYGVGFHHAGITTEERDLIANAYDKGVLKVCVATCSLAAGINLPARRVILHNARMGREFVGPSMLRQMRGRAGRKGKDEVGETYLCCREEELGHVVDLMHSDLPAITSSLNTDERRVQRALLEAISIRLVATFESIYDYLSKTLLYHYDESMDLASLTTKCIDQLQELKVVEYSDVKEEYTATQLGQAIVASSFNPEDGLFIHRELQRALKSFVMDGDLHVFYIFTPVSVSDVVVNWQIFMDEAEKLDKSGERVLQVVGIDMCHLMKLSRGAVLHEETAEEREKARIMKRFYLAFQLRDLCNEVPVHIVARKYDMPRGMVQNLSQTSQGFAAGMVKFCDIMGWGALSAVLDHFMDRLKAGARSDLLELAKITFIKSRTARIFWDNGFKTVASIANAAPTELVPVLMQAEPNKIRAQDSPDDNRSKRLLAKAKIISDSANRLWRKFAGAVVTEFRICVAGILTTYVDCAEAEVEASRFEEGQE
ncbi:DNA polymerase theta subunit [Ceratocystis lukuohia]|uniref:DNA polymerase theta subunit n=1 Tax=Ceratocystis lukuohia TaxID=2019550 RepID=A0ABR4MNE8_9PEZI